MCVAWFVARPSALHAGSRLAAPGHEREVASGFGPVRYELTARLDEATHEVHGKGVIYWRNASKTPQGELWLHAYLEAFRDARPRILEVDATRGFRGDPTLTHLGGLSISRLFARELQADLWPTADRNEPTDVRVPLPRAIAPGEELTLDVEFVAALPSLALRTGFIDRFHMVAQWFPKLARLEPDGTWAHFPLRRFAEFYADFGDYDVTVDIPSSMRVGATGVAVGSTEEAGRQRIRFLAERVHDFAFAAWDGFEEIRQMAGTTELVALFPRGERGEAEIELRTVARGLAYFGERYGAYPYRRLTVVRPPAEASEAGGMEYPTLVTTGASQRGRFLGVRRIESIALHELAHQWFQGMIASDERRYPMLDEGLATYAELDAMEAMWPGHSGFDAFGLRVSEEAVFRSVARDVAGAGPLDRPAELHADGRAYVGLAYARSAILLRTIGRVFGEEQLRRALERYAAEQRFAHPTPQDLIDVVRREVGPSAARALEQGIDGERCDVRAVRFDSRKVTDDRGEARWEGTIELGRAGSLALPVEVEVWTEGGSRSRLTWDGEGDTTRLAWRGDGPITAVLVDPDGRLLLDEERVNDTIGGGTSASRALGLASLLVEIVTEVMWP